MAHNKPVLVDLTHSPAKKRAAPDPEIHVGQTPAAKKATAVELAKAKPKTLKASVPHALLWICAAGKGQSRSWKASALKVVGVYASKEEAEAKKQRVMDQHECCGHGDILVGETWEDEIDLVVRPIGELDL